MLKITPLPFAESDYGSRSRLALETQTGFERVHLKLVTEVSLVVPARCQFFGTEKSVSSEPLGAARQRRLQPLTVGGVSQTRRN